MQLAEPRPVIAVWREPYSLAAPTVERWREGMTVYEIVKAMRCLPSDFEECGYVTINGHVVNRGAWHLVRPNASSQTLPIAVTFHRPLHGGKGGKSSGKAVIGIVALLALTVLTAGIAGGLAAGLGGSTGLFAAGSISAKILAGAVGLIGSLAVSALTRPPAARQNSDNQQALETASADGNLIEPNGSIPRVIGTRKVYPSLAAEPLVTLIGSDEYVEVAYILNGPHDISDIKISNTTIDDQEHIEYEVREGWPTDEPITIVTRYARTSSQQTQLSEHRLRSNSQTELENPTNPEESCPDWHRFSTADSPDDAVIHFLLPSGMSYAPDPSTIPMGTPIRIRIRKLGDTAWVNLPELHYYSVSQRTQRAQVILHWDHQSPRTPSQSTMQYGQGFWAAVYQAKAQNVTPVESAPSWTADSYFYLGSGDNSLSYANLPGGTTGLRNICIDSNGQSEFKQYFSISNAASQTTCHVYLDSGTFPKGIYEIEIIKGSIYNTGIFNPESYIFGGAIKNLYRYANTGTMHLSQLGISGPMAVSRIVSIWNEHPIPNAGFATIAIRGKNKQVQQVSCNASAYVKDWDGTGWNTWTTTSNPAPHLRDILCGTLNLDPVPESLIDDASLVDWRTNCVSNDYTCDLIVNDMRLEDVLSLVASCGYARPYWSDKWGVIQDYDRSAESPVQVFSPRNSKGFKSRKAFARLPDGLLVSFRDELDDSKTRQIPVYRDGVIVSDNARMEQVTYDGLITEAKVRQRAEFDLHQGEYRTTFYSLEASVESIVCRRGSLVAVNHDIISRHTGAGRIISVAKSAGNILSITLDTEIDLSNEDDMLAIPDMLAVTDMLQVGLTMGCSIRRADGAIVTYAISNATGANDTLTLSTPVADDTMTGSSYDGGTISKICEGCLVVVGPIDQEYIRLIVTEVAPGADLTARLTMVDEAPELWV